MALLASFLIGVVAGLRSLTAPAVVAWAAWLGWVDVKATWAAWLGHPVTVAVLTVLAVGELVVDKLPNAPSRKAAAGFGARIVTGGFSGSVLACSAGLAVWGALLGVIGAVVGTLGGYQARSRLAAAAGRDLPVALLEDAVAVAGALAIVGLL